MQFFFDYPLFFGISFFVLGAVMGSFINVLYYRLPKNMSIVKPGSHCPECSKPLKWYNNIPILSYVFQKGHSTCCKSKVPVRYFLFEIFSGLLSVALFAAIVNSRFLGLNIADVVMLFVFLYLSIPIAMIDAKHMVLPMLLVIPGALAGAAMSFFTHRVLWHDSLLALIVFSVLIALVRLIFTKILKKEAMGEGDIYLAGMIGAFCGVASIAAVLLFSSITGIIYGLISMIKNKNRIIPYGPFLLLGAWAFIVLQLFGGVYEFYSLIGAVVPSVFGQ